MTNKLKHDLSKEQQKRNLKERTEILKHRVSNYDHEKDLVKKYEQNLENT